MMRTPREGIGVPMPTALMFSAVPLFHFSRTNVTEAGLDPESEMQITLVDFFKISLFSCLDSYLQRVLCIPTV